jgi:glycosyltransferase involved in cell wall biosynthesis
MPRLRRFHEGKKANVGRTPKAGRMPRVMIVGPGPGGAGGIAVVIETLVASPLAERYELRQVVTHTDSGRTGKALRAAMGIARAVYLLALRRVDLVYLHASSGPSLRRKSLVAAIARLARRPYVVHVHAGGFDRYYRSARVWEQRLMRRTLAGAALVITLSRWSERRVQALAPCRTTVIPNPVTIPPEPARLHNSPPRVVCLGRVGAGKGSTTLVRALSILGDRDVDARLVLAGDGDVSPVVEEARRLGVSDRVELPGWIGPEERERTLLAAAVFALPSREEGVPVALLEAMAYGLPAVVTPVGGIPDVFEEGRHGYFVPPDDPDALADRLAALLDAPELARRMGAQARADAEARYATEVVAALVADALQSVLLHRRS